MNRKLLVAAVSAAVLAPAVGYAEATLYGHVTNGINIDDISSEPGASSQTDLNSFGSRIGVKVDSDIGNGMTGHGKYEFSTNADRHVGVNGTRVATVGLSGAFGRVDLGQQWSAYFNTYGTLVYPSYTVDYYLFTVVGGGISRSSNTIKYSNSFGPLHAQLDVRLDDTSSPEENAQNGDGFGWGLSWAVNNNLTIAATWDHENGADGTRAVTPAKAPVAGVPGNAFGISYTYDHDGLASTPEVAPSPSVLAAYAAITTDTDERESDFIASFLKAANANRPEGAPNVVAPTDYTAPVNGNPEFSTNADHPDTRRMGIAIKGTFGGYWASLGWQNYQVDDNERTPGDDEVDVDTILLHGGGNISEKTKWWLGYSYADDGKDAVARVFPIADDPDTAGVVETRYGVDAVAATDDSSQITWGISHNLGGGLHLHYEGTSVDSEERHWDGIRHVMAMRLWF